MAVKSRKSAKNLLLQVLEIRAKQLWKTSRTATLTRADTELTHCCTLCVLVTDNEPLLLF